MTTDVRGVLSAEFPSDLVDRLLDCYGQLRENYSLGKFRPSELEAGRFCEVVFRMLEAKTNLDAKFTPLDRALVSVDALVRNLEQLDTSLFHDSVRLHIPRVLKSIYNIRNRRDVGHVSGDVSPNVADAALVITNVNWVIGELIRLYFQCTVEEAQTLVDGLVERRLPLIQDFNGFLKTLNPALTVRQRILALLYFRGDLGATRAELGDWLKGKTGSSISNELPRLENEDLIHRDGTRSLITRRGILFAEQTIPFDSPPSGLVRNRRLTRKPKRAS